MGTKNNPGRFDCYARAHPDEPMFTLLGRDPDAQAIVSLWAILRHRRDPADPKVQEAIACANAMRAWCVERAGRTPACPDDVLEAATRGMPDHPEDYDLTCECDECLSCP